MDPADIRERNEKNTLIFFFFFYQQSRVWIKKKGVYLSLSLCRLAAFAGEFWIFLIYGYERLKYFHGLTDKVCTREIFKMNVFALLFDKCIERMIPRGRNICLDSNL